MKNNRSFVYVLVGLFVALAAVLGMRGCTDTDAILRPGERVVDKVDWGNASPEQFAGKVFTYTRLIKEHDKKTATIVILVPFAAGQRIEKVPAEPEGGSFRVHLVTRTDGGTAAGVYQLTIDGISTGLADIIVQLDENDHDVVLADADDESITVHPANDPIPVMSSQLVGGAVVVEGFLVLPDGSTVTPDTAPPTSGDEVRTMTIAKADGALEIHYLRSGFGAPPGHKKLQLQEGARMGRSWSQTYR